MNNRFLVQLLTSRRNYDVAEILHGKEMLSYLVTDFYRTFLSKYIKKIFPLYRFVYNAHNNNLPIVLVKRSIMAGILYRIKIKISPNNNYGATLQSYKILTHKSIRLIKRDKMINSIYAYDTGALELFEYIVTHDSNIKNLYLEQCVAPRSAQIAMYKKFSSLYNVDYSEEIASCEKLHLRELKEWDLATKIIVPSDYVCNEIVKCGVNPEKICIVPYGYSSPYNFYEIENHIKKKQQKQSEKIILLYVGNGGYRKGVLDLIDLAAKLKNFPNIELRIAGNMANIQDHIKNIEVNNVTFLGVLDKKRLNQEYLDADIFILPSYLEGSAMSIQEALCFGLPVITTFESGSFIVNNQEGFIFNAGDIEGMYNGILLLARNNQLRYMMAYKAIELMKKNTLSTYQDNLLSVLS